MKQLIAVIVLVAGAVIAVMLPPQARYITGYAIGTIVTLVLCLTDEDDY